MYMYFLVSLYIHAHVHVHTGCNNPSPVLNVYATRYIQAERDGLVREWQEVGLQLLSDIDSRLSTVHTHIANLTLHSAQVGH